MKKPKYRIAQERLLASAKMTVFELNTSVYLSEDTTLRVGSSHGMLPLQADRVRIKFRVENFPGAPWYDGHLSPARAKMFAYDLLRRAEYAERNEKNPRR